MYFGTSFSVVEGFWGLISSPLIGTPPALNRTAAALRLKKSVNHGNIAKSLTNIEPCSLIYTPYVLRETR
jgi:hypothetical protein